VLLLAGYLLSEPLGVPVSLPASIVAVVFLFLARRSQAMSVTKVIRSAPWKIVVFSLGMYLVVYGLRNAGLTNHLSSALNSAQSAGVIPLTLIGGFGAAIMSAIMNNLPTVLIGCISIAGSSVHGISQLGLVYANVVGSDLGPKFTPIGSLATLLWLHVLESKGVKIGWGQYFKTGIVLTVPVLLVTLLALSGWLLLIRP
jgi:arsenical pump membrane protein